MELSIDDTAQVPEGATAVEALEATTRLSGRG